MSASTQRVPRWRIGERFSDMETICLGSCGPTDDSLGGEAGKSPGLDNIPAEKIKNSGEMGIKSLHHLCCQIWKQQEWPEDWKLQEFVMLYKNGNSKECGNYRAIALISHACKILLIIILNRMKCKVEEELSDCQAGYRANRGTTDMLFVLQIIIEKIRDGNEEGYITFIDYSKAFDSVIHSNF
ncbi:RNA-directed DNA polymerase (Reverse transcriptase) domain containing protein [Elysia marginata]|uniref:RNA-directed DNA polymerase (Reverse transcriptase) domain containing protein n=1 Tax=Elysia marginata TaxID=1093978 RepID=A0AAV4JKB6_9GAST|nr:RNA-directed DNA polymerase (Reverse transcriptase) domain containing protein [Elysia marginata]